MKPQIVRIDLATQAAGYDIAIGHALLDGLGKWARRSLGKSAAKVAIVSDPTVFGLYGKRVEDSLRSAGFTVFVQMVPPGESRKTLKTAESILKFLAASGISRTDAVVALGGGVIGDLAGFASAVYLRGVPFLQVPTTLLSMIDSSVGGKTGVNSAFGKNLIGAFHQPRGVLIDTATLETLPARELTAGFCEAVKQGAIGGAELLSQTGDFLKTYPAGKPPEDAGGRDFRDRLANLIAAHVMFKAGIVAGDERESSNRVDGRSRKILNFGHTLAHALEKVTSYKYLRHGEAVGYGILFAAEVSKSLALIDEKVVNLLYDVVHRAGVLPKLSNIDPNEVFEAFRFDKKHLSGSLQMVLLKGVGRPVIIAERDIPHSTLRQALKKLLQ